MLAITGLDKKLRLTVSQLPASGPAGRLCLINRGILDQNDNSLFGDFFSNPDIANQMNLSYNTPIERSGDGEESKARFPGGLFDMDFPSGMINDRAAAFATQHMGQGGEYHMQPYASCSVLQRGMGDQTGGTPVGVAVSLATGRR